MDLDPRRSVRLLAVTITVLLLAHAAGQVTRFFLHPDRAVVLIRLFDFDGERNVPTLFSSALLLATAALFWSIGQGRRGQRWGRHWKALAAISVLLAIDETAGLHESVGGRLRSGLGAPDAPYVLWTIPYGILLLAMLLAFLRFLGSLPGRFRRRLLWAGAVYVGGAVGVEVLGWLYLEQTGQHGDLAYAAMATVEEALEMAGAVLAIRALLSYIGSELDGLELLVRPATPRTESRCS